MRSCLHKPLETWIVEDERAFVALREEWDGLHQNSHLATPFQSWAWLYSWWEHYGEGHDLRLVTVRDGEGLLVGIIPLMLERGRAGLGGLLGRRLLFVGTGITDHLDALVREGSEGLVAEAAVRALGRIGGWRVADLQELRPGAAAWGLFRGWGGPKAAVWQSGCPVVEVEPWNDLLASLSKKSRNNARRALRRAEEDGISFALAGPEEAGQAARRLIALHRESWRDRGIGPEHLTRRFENHIVAASRRMAASGLGAICEFRRGEEVVLSDLLLFGRDWVGDYLGGATDHATRRYQTNSLVMWSNVSVARDRDTARLNMLRGLEPYKLRWSSNIEHNHRAILGRDPAFWAPYAAYHTLRSRAKWYVNGEEAPTWIKNAAGRYRILRTGAARLSKGGLKRARDTASYGD